MYTGVSAPDNYPGVDIQSEKSFPKAIEVEEKY